MIFSRAKNADPVNVRSVVVLPGRPFGPAGDVSSQAVFRGSPGQDAQGNLTTSDWWFGTFFIFPNSWDDFLQSDELIFFRGVGQPPTRPYFGSENIAPWGHEALNPLDHVFLLRWLGIYTIFRHTFFKWYNQKSPLKMMFLNPMQGEIYDTNSPLRVICMKMATSPWCQWCQHPLDIGSHWAVNIQGEIDGWAFIKVQQVWFKLVGLEHYFF